MAEDSRHIRPFAEWLQEHRGGLLHGELSDALNLLAAAVTEHGKQGEIVLRIKIKPAGAGENTVLVGDDVRVKVPEGDKPAALFFVTPDANLSRLDPRQPSLPIRGLPGVKDDEAPEAGVVGS